MEQHLHCVAKLAKDVAEFLSSCWWFLLLQCDLEFLSQNSYTAPWDEFPKNSKILRALDVRCPRVQIM